MTWTVDEVVSWGTCYSEERVRELLTDPVTPETIAELDIPAADRVCLLLRHETMGPQLQLRLALDMASTLLEQGADATRLHEFITDDSMRPDDPGTGHARDYCPQPLTWLLVRLSARLHNEGVLPLEQQLRVILEYYARD